MLEEMSRKRKNAWTAQLVPLGTLATNECHQHLSKTSRQREDMVVSAMRMAIVGYLEEIASGEFGDDDSPVAACREFPDKIPA